MANDKRWLAKPTSDFGEAFPNVNEIDFEVDDNPSGFYNPRGVRPIKVTRGSAKGSIPCPNERCRRGGFPLGDFLANHTFSGTGTITIDNTYPCGGDEGTPGGRKQGDPCMNSFKVKGTIKFKS